VPTEITEVGEVLAVLEPRLVADLVPAPADLLMELGNHLSRARLALSDATGTAVIMHRISTTLARRSRNTRLGVLIQQQVDLTICYIRAAHLRGWEAGASLDAMQEVVDALRRGDGAASAELIAVWRRDLTRALASRCGEVA
jgi:DNA-binding GntR family transcriptional regulator